MSETTVVAQVPATEETSVLVFNKTKFAAFAIATVAVAGAVYYVKTKMSSKDSDEQTAE